MASKERAFFIFLMIFGIALAFYIGFQIISYYKEAKGFSDRTANPSVRCTGYLYSITGMSYGKGELRFRIRNQEYSDYEISRMTIGANQTYSLQIRIPQGVERDAAIGIEKLPENFLIYPEDCLQHAKKCNKAEMSCK